MAQPHVVYKKSGIKSASGLNLRSAEWMILTQINGNQSIQEIANVVSQPVKDVTQTMYNLFQVGLIELYQTEFKRENLIGASFFENLEQVLMQVIGPVAPYVIDDILVETNQSKSKFPAERVAELIELISDEINDENKKIKFQSDMLAYIKKEIF